MVCRNMCMRSYSKMVVGQSHYSVGKSTAGDVNAILLLKGWSANAAKN